MKIDKISREVMRAGTNNGLTLKEKHFTDVYLKEKNGTEAVKQAYNIKSKNIDNVAGVIAKENLSKPKIQKTIQEVLTENKITEDSTIKRHNLIIDKAIDINQLSTAEKGNTRFMEMLGILEKKPETSNTFNILNLNISELEEKDIKKRLFDIISQKPTQ